MDPITIIAMANAAMTLLKEAIPEIKSLFENGNITTDEQKAVMEEFNSLKTDLADHFSGPEWQISGR